MRKSVTIKARIKYMGKATPLIDTEWQDLLDEHVTDPLKEVIGKYFRSHQRTDGSGSGCWCSICQEVERLYPNETMCDWL